MSDDVVLFEERTAANGKRIGFAWLNAEKSLNALSQAMIDLLRPKLADWAADDGIACVVLLGSGERAFCAGGDVVGLYHAMKDKPGRPNELAERFFETEYRLDYQIHTYPKPLLCWGDGIVMGGGLGLMSGCSHRVVTERSRIAMPEGVIGFFPDVAGTWFLNRMPGRTGLYLGLTGASMNAADALYLDLGNYFVHSAQRDAVFAALTDIRWSEDTAANQQELSLLLRRFTEQSQAALPASKVQQHRQLIDRITDCTSVEGIVAALRAEGSADDWIAGGLKSLERSSPTAVKVFLEQYRRGRHLSLKEVFILELNMAVQFTRRHDFAEGVRALLVDKDRNPQWQPATLEEVSDAEVAAHFLPPAGFDPSPLADL
ncbi:MAG TPA: enoyl-CoA hydratase/isomerase family protein [Gammaproteobacteria bacterium]|nr:enoyl-CoA hydratase/isomerase family protein [Gammaproteobacteria bacterium]